MIILGSGPAFSGGHNLKELTKEEGAEHHSRVFHACALLMEDVVTAHVPVVAAVDGIAAAAGCQLVAICDLAVATKRLVTFAVTLNQYHVKDVCN